MTYPKMEKQALITNPRAKPTVKIYTPSDIFIQIIPFKTFVPYYLGKPAVQ